MLHNYYCIGTSNQFNLKFESPTCDGVWTIPDIRYNLRDLLDYCYDEFDGIYNGYKQFLFLQKSENTKKYWKVIMGIWYRSSDCNNGYPPNQIVRFTTINFRSPVRDKYTGKYWEQLPLDVFNDDNIRMFY